MVSVATSCIHSPFSLMFTTDRSSLFIYEGSETPLQLLRLVRTFWWEDSSAFDLAAEWLPSPIATNCISRLRQVSQGVCATTRQTGDEFGISAQRFRGSSYSFPHHRILWHQLWPNKWKIARKSTLSIFLSVCVAFFKGEVVFLGLLSYP